MDPLQAHLADFSLNLLRDVGLNNTNVFCSPLSITIALAMTLAGAGGDTKSQLRANVFGAEITDESIHSAFNTILSETLALPVSEPQLGNFGAVTNRQEQLRVNIANNLYPSKRIMAGQRIHQSYLTRLQGSYKMSGDLNILDYGQSDVAAKTINSWVERQTNGKIKNLIDPSSLGIDTALILVNAIYFKSPWLNPFTKGFTTAEKFYQTTSDAGKNVPMMKLSKSLPYYADAWGQYDVALLPYANPNYNMFILLPRRRDGVTDIMRNMTGNRLLSALNAARDAELQLSLPKFKMESKFKLKPTLQNLGISKLFANADLSGMSAAPLHVTEVTHMAVIEVDEDGTEAAAATAVQVGFRSAFNPAVPVEFRVDHPFLLGIWEKTRNQLVFLGKLTNPQ